MLNNEIDLNHLKEIPIDSLLSLLTPGTPGVKINTQREREGARKGEAYSGRS